MRNWDAYVRERLPLSPPARTRASRVIREIAVQLEDCYRDAVARGLSPEDADREACRQVTDWDRLARDLGRADSRLAVSSLESMTHRLDEAALERNGRWALVSGFWQDIRSAWRQFVKRPGFALVATLTLALGIGANTAMFGVMRGVLLRPLPYPDPDRIVRVFEIVPQSGRFSVSPAAYFDWRDQNASFEAIAAYSSGGMTLSDGTTSERVNGAGVSAPLFDVLRVPPALGRSFTASEDLGPARVVIISHRLWQRRFAGDPDVLGRSLTINGSPVTVIGVMPEGFSFPSLEADLWTPLGVNPVGASRGGHYLSVIARLKDGQSVESAGTEMRGIAERLALEYPEMSAGESAGVIALHEDIVGGVRRPLLTLLVAVGLVVLIACGNVANLLLVRASTAGKDFAIRLALGARPHRVVRQMLTESLVLAFIGGLVGVGLAYLAMGPIRALAAGSVPRTDGIQVESSVLFFALGLSIVTGLVFGAAPAWQASRSNLTDALKDGGRSAVGGRGRRIRSALVVVEVALSLMLLVGASLLLRSFANLTAVDPGFDARGVLTFRVALPASPPNPDEHRRTYYGTLLERLAALPDARAVGMTQSLPLQGRYVLSVTFQGRPDPLPAERPSANYRAISPGYFDALNVPLSRGRVFSERDTATAPLVAIIDETFARRHFPNEDPIGRGLDIGNGTDGFVEIVGIVADVRHEGLELTTEPTMYVPFAQDPFGTMAVVIRSDREPLALAPAVRTIMQDVNRGVPPFAIAALADVVDGSMASRRFSTLLLGSFAGIALFLAAVGLYGVLSYAVTQRTQEIGVRLAIGAAPPQLLRMVVGDGLKLTLAGIALGLAGALALSRLVTSLLFDVTPFDPVSYVLPAVILLAVSVLACHIPARRAMRVDPILALRSE